MDPDVSCQYAATDMSLDTDSLVLPEVTASSGRVPARHAADHSSCLIKKTAADARAANVNPANEHVDKGKTKYPCRRKRKEEVKQMGTFREAACFINKNNKIKIEEEGIKTNFVHQHVSTERLRSPEGQTATILG